MNLTQILEYGVAALTAFGAVWTSTQVGSNDEISHWVAGILAALVAVLALRRRTPNHGKANPPSVP